MAYVKRNKPMDWTEAIVTVLTKAGGGPMHFKEITNEIIRKGYYSTASSKNPENTVNSYLSRNKKLFKLEEPGVYALIGTPVTATHTTVARVAPAVVRSSTSVRPCTSYSPADSEYKCASDFIEDSSDLTDLEKNLLELIVNFPLPLVTGEVCFADILDDLEVQFLKTGSRTQLIDAALLKKKLDELNKHIKELEIQQQNNPQLSDLNGSLLRRMRYAAEEAKQRLQENTSDDGIVKFEYPILGEFISGEESGSKPRVVIYLESIENNLKSYESRGSVMAGVFVHEMFHAWNYFNAGQRSKSVLAIDEPMVEFETLYYLEKLKAFTESKSHALKNYVLDVKLTREFRVQNKQQAVGDVAAYGFGHYLYEKLSESDTDSITWIETYFKKSASIKSSDPFVPKVKAALIPIYPFKSEKQVMNWFKKIIFDTKAASKTAGTSTTAKGTSATAKDGIDISLRKLVLACIEMIDRKCFDAQELYAFAPIFKVCLPECKDLENALKQQLDELVNDDFLEALSDDCYRKLEGVEVKPKSPSPTSPTTLVSTPTKSKSGRTKAPSVAFKVEFPDDKITYEEETAVMTYIRALKHIGLSRVQSLGKMHSRYALVSNVEDPNNSGKSLQHYEGGKYIYTKLGNEQKKGYLYQIANELGIKISIRDI